MSEWGLLWAERMHVLSACVYGLVVVNHVDPQCDSLRKKARRRAHRNKKNLTFEHVSRAFATADETSRQ